MTWTTTEQRYIVNIETRLDEIDTALNNLATRSELKTLLAMLRQEITELERNITQLALTGNIETVSLIDYDNDTAAALGGVQIGELYHTDGVVKVRLV